ncbi:MAG TPA: hypothetical protein VM659_21630 [Dongiaceae bacterium]|nr:hypothetical protein [Dongiaceae bacterium]
MAKLSKLDNWSIIRLSSGPGATCHFVGIGWNHPYVINGHTLMSSEIEEVSADVSRGQTQNTLYLLSTPCSREQFVAQFEARVKTYLEAVYGFADEFGWISAEEWRLEDMLRRGGRPH